MLHAPVFRSVDRHMENHVSGGILELVGQPTNFHVLEDRIVRGVNVLEREFLIIRSTWKRTGKRTCRR